MRSEIGHIRIVSPSGAIAEELIEGAKQRLLSIGAQVTEGQYARHRVGRFAATDEQRLADLNAAIDDPTVDIILCSRGGYGMQRIIDSVHPITKPIVGFSDITELHQLAGLNHQPSLHAIMCKHMAQHQPSEEVFTQTLAALLGEALHYTTPAHPLNRAGQAEGVLTGGNLSVLYGLQGTPFSLTASIASGLTAKRSFSEAVFQQSGPQKPLLLIEDIGERHYHIDRMMNNLRLSGMLEQIGGMIVGQFTDCEDDELMGETVYETIARYVAPYDYPVLFDFPIGHVERNMPIWLNKKIRLTVTPSGGQVDQD